MDIETLKLFAHVAHRGSFAAAAKDRDMDPSNVSRIISQLEDELGFRLFQRTTRNMRITEAGELYLTQIKATLDDLERARSEAENLNNKASGTLRITASVTFAHHLIVPLLGEFRTLYPDVKVEGLFVDENIDLVRERIDLAIRLAPEVDGDFVVTKLMDTNYRLVASPDYLASAQKLEKPEDLRHHRCILLSLPAFREQWLFRATDETVVGVAVDGDFVLSNAISIHKATLAGLGPALLPEWLIRNDLESGALVSLFPEFEIAATSFDTAAFMIYPSKSYLPNKVRVMMDFLRLKIKPAVR